MSDNPNPPSQAVALIKFFSKEEHYLAFKKGVTFFRTPHYYRNNNDIGRGDRSESCFGYWDKQLGDRLPNIIINSEKINIDDIQSLLVYPAAEQKDAWMQSWSVIGPHNNFENSLAQMINEFGAYFVLLPSNKISAYAYLISKTSGCKVNMGLISYSDNLLERSLVVKDSKFSYQKEFRFFVSECTKHEIKDKKITLQGLKKILFKASSLKFTSQSGEIKYCSLGHNKVVSG